MVKSRLFSSILSSLGPSGWPDDAMTLDPDTPTITPEIFAQRKAFASFTDEDAQLLSELRETFTEHADEIVTQFYAHLDRFDEVRVPIVEVSRRVDRVGGVEGDGP